MKSKKQLDKLIAYCEEHPEQRFFQAISNCFGFAYLGKADSPDGENFYDLFFEESD